MSDRHLCKAKRIDAGEWVEGYYFCMVHTDGRHAHHFIIPLGADLSLGTPIDKIQVEVNPTTLCYCTGLKEEVMSNNTVWENEIYRWDNPAYGRCTGIIRFGGYLQDGSGNEYAEIPCFGFYTEVVKVEPYPKSGMDEDDYPDYLRTISVLEMFERNSDVELLGNIFDNPELLKGGAE